MKHYSSIGRRNRGRPLKRLLDTWDRNGSTSGLTPWQTYDDDNLNLLRHYSGTREILNAEAAGLSETQFGTSLHYVTWQTAVSFTTQEISQDMYAYCVCVLLVTEAELVSQCWLEHRLLDAVAKFGKPTVSFISNYPHGTTRPHWTDFHEIWRVSIFMKFVEVSSSSVNISQEWRVLTWRPGKRVAQLVEAQS